MKSDRLEVLDRPDPAGFVTARLRRGDWLRVRTDQTPRNGWLAIEPVSTAICWIERASLEFEDAASEPAASLGADSAAVPASGPASWAWVRRPRAVLRSGNLGARLPGPPRGTLPAGIRVQLVDRPPLALGDGNRKAGWVAIVPPPDLVDYVRVEPGQVHWDVPPTPPVPPAAEVRASYEEPMPSSPSAGQADAPRGQGQGRWPEDVAAELERLDGLHRVIVASQPLEQWHFETVREGYQSLLRRARDLPDLEEALRARLAALTRHEQAAKSARTIESILARGRERDQQVAQIRQQLARGARSGVRDFDAIGFIQPSARTVEGRKLFALIGREGSAIAYLDIPPGLDPRPLLARRVGIRGRARFREELGTRLITVRDMESLEARK